MPIHPSLLQYYSQNNESARHQRQQLEFDLTRRFFQDWLPQERSAHLLEVGAGSGHYTRWLLERGYRVTAIEPTPALVDELKKIQNEYPNHLTVILGDETEVPKLRGQQFARVLLMGPLYHLFSDDERKNLLRSSHELLTPQGSVFSVFLSRVGFLSYLLKNDPLFIARNPTAFETILRMGFEPDHFVDGQFKGHFDRLDQLLHLYRELNLSITSIMSLDPLIGPFDELYNQLTQDLKPIWLEIAYHASSWPESLGSSRTWAIVSQS